jgi:hypothetical protein
MVVRSRPPPQPLNPDVGTLNRLKWNPNNANTLPWSQSEKSVACAITLRIRPYRLCVTSIRTILDLGHDCTATSMHSSWWLGKTGET